MGEAIVIAALSLLSAMTVPGSLSAPVPEHLTAACQVRSVQASNGTYFYDSIEHCRKK